MAETKHTPGPWEWTGDALEGPSNAGPPSYGCVIERSVSCGAYCQGGSAVLDISDADRRLIAASPDLLATLERIAYHGEIDSRTADGWTKADIVANARRAIAKATGADHG